MKAQFCRYFASQVVGDGMSSGKDTPHKLTSGLNINAPCSRCDHNGASLNRIIGGPYKKLLSNVEPFFNQNLFDQTVVDCLSDQSQRRGRCLFRGIREGNAAGFHPSSHGNLGFHHNRTAERGSCAKRLFSRSHHATFGRHDSLALQQGFRFELQDSHAMSRRVSAMGRQEMMKGSSTLLASSIQTLFTCVYSRMASSPFSRP